jgi:hypothetical protein
VHQVGFSIQDYIEIHGQQNVKFNGVEADTVSLDEYCWNQYILLEFAWRSCSKYRLKETGDETHETK